MTWALVLWRNCNFNFWLWSKRFSFSPWWKSIYDKSVVLMSIIWSSAVLMRDLVFVKFDKLCLLNSEWTIIFMLANFLIGVIRLNSMEHELIRSSRVMWPKSVSSSCKTRAFFTIGSSLISTSKSPSIHFVRPLIYWLDPVYSYVIPLSGCWHPGWQQPHIYIYHAYTKHTWYFYLLDSGAVCYEYRAFDRARLRWDTYYYNRRTAHWVTD